MILYNITHLSARFNQKGNRKTMDKHVTFSTQGVCAREITFDIAFLM